MIASLIPKVARHISRLMTGANPTFALMERRLRALRSRIGQDLSSSFLVIRQDEIGDFVLTTGMLRELRTAYPKAQITLVVKPEVYNLAETCPYADNIIPFNLPSAGLFLEARQWLAALRFARQQLWPLKIGTAIVPRWDADATFSVHLAYFSGASRRIAYSSTVSTWKNAHNGGNDKLLTDALVEPGGEHEALYAVRTLRPLGIDAPNAKLEIWPTADDKQRGRELLNGMGVRPNERLVAVAPSGGNSHLKQWPVARFAELSKRIIANGDADRVVIIGGSEAIPLAGTIAGAIGGDKIVIAAGKTSLRETAALIGLCIAYIGNDTGPMHIAAAAGIPVIGILGGSCYHRFRPWSSKARLIVREIPCRPCGVEHVDRCVTCPYEAPLCLDEISVDDVLNELSELLAVTRQN